MTNQFLNTILINDIVTHKQNISWADNVFNILKSIPSTTLSTYIYIFKNGILKQLQSGLNTSIYFSKNIDDIKFLHVIFSLPILFIQKSKYKENYYEIEVDLTKYINRDVLFSNKNTPVTFKCTVYIDKTTNIKRLDSIYINNNLINKNSKKYKSSKIKIIHTCCCLNLIVIHFILHNTNDLILNSTIKHLQYNNGIVVKLILNLSTSSQFSFWGEKQVTFEKTFNNIIGENLTNHVFGLLDDPVINVKEESIKFLNYKTYFKTINHYNDHWFKSIYTYTKNFCHSLISFTKKNNEYGDEGIYTQILYDINSNINETTDTKITNIHTLLNTYITNIILHNIYHHLLRGEDPNIIIRRDIEKPFNIRNINQSNLFDVMRETLSYKYYNLINEYQKNIESIMFNRFPEILINSSICV